MGQFKADDFSCAHCVTKYLMLHKLTVSILDHNLLNESRCCFHGTQIRLCIVSLAFALESRMYRYCIFKK